MKILSFSPTGFCSVHHLVAGAPPPLRARDVDDPAEDRRTGVQSAVLPRRRRRRHGPVVPGGLREAPGGRAGADSAAAGAQGRDEDEPGVQVVEVPRVRRPPLDLVPPEPGPEPALGIDFLRRDPFAVRLPDSVSFFFLRNLAR